MLASTCEIMAQASEQLMALLKPKCPCHQYGLSNGHFWLVLEPSTKMQNGPHLYLNSSEEGKSSLKWPTVSTFTFGRCELDKGTN